MCKKESYVVSAAIVVAVVTMLFFPVTGTPGNLDPGVAPDSTMKTLDQIPPTWNQKLQCDSSACPRFELVLGGAGVLDKETGLVWEKSPENAGYIWAGAIVKCAQLEVDGRKGWHSPTIEQLVSLVDTSVSGSLKLPAGHPFIGGIGVPTFIFWSATTYADGTWGAWEVNFANGVVDHSDKMVGNRNVWCVRGGQGYDGM